MFKDKSICIYPVTRNFKKLDFKIKKYKVDHNYPLKFHFNS